MRQIGFGKKYKDLPIPTIVRVFVDSWSAIAGSLVTSINIADFIPDKAGHIISWILGASIPIVQSLKPYFGVKTNEKSVPVKDVKELDEHEEKIS